MPTALGLLEDATWHGVPLPGGRAQALLAALVQAGGRPVTDQALVEAVWGADDPPANPAKSLQVVVSRARSQTGADVVTRTGHGYRLGLAEGEVDALVLRGEVAAARAAEARHDAVAARDHARAAVAVPVTAGAAGVLGDLREAALIDRADAAACLGRALSALGDHAEALPLLEAATGDDEASLTALLRSLASVQGAPAALDRYESLRAGLADRLGVDPGPALRAVHAELLAADHPVRSGLRFASASLVGRDDDLRALRGLVRQARVVSILGPGGLGKTRLANLLAAGAEQSVVHVVELVGISSAEDVVGEVGSALGVRDSLTGRRTLTPDQRRDVRARIAQTLDQAPTLLVLDNCEHVVEAVADLVAYLVATVRELRVVTTTRAPLAIAAERVFALGQLAEDDAVDLFAQRARAARPGVLLDEHQDGGVRRVVRRLDGLPLAIELAAAKVRVMSVEDIDRRLDDRFALLRGGDRSAPDRHQTLLAVIDWSWNLLTEAQRRALRWLSVFHDGFALSGAESLLGGDVLDELQALVDQSLLTVLEGDHGVRYRMLETVREFGRMQLVGAGEDAAARAARRAWACGLAGEQAGRLWGPDQVSAVHTIAGEENNLSDCLRSALSAADHEAVACLTAALGWTWTIRGENLRVMAVAEAVSSALTGWQPPDALVDVAVLTAAAVVINSMFGDVTVTGGCRGLLRDHRDRAISPRVRALADVVDAEQDDDVDATVARLDALADAASAGAAQEGDAGVDVVGRAVLARVWAANQRENAGDLPAALSEIERALELLPGHDDPWLATLTDSLAASLNAHVGRHRRAAEYARAALPGLERLGATDDVAQTRGLLVFDAIAAGRLDDAAAEIDLIEGMDVDQTFFGGAHLVRMCRAEVALARGELAEGLACYRDARTRMSNLVLPGLTDEGEVAPWLLASEAAAVAAYARYGSPEVGDGDDLHDVLEGRLPTLLEPGRRHVDFPVLGLVLYALAAWRLLRDDRAGPTAVRLLALSTQLSFPRSLPSLETSLTEAAAETGAPGLLSQARAEYAGLRGPALLAVARDVLAASSR